MKGSTRSIAGLMTLVALAAVSIAALRASDALAADMVWRATTYFPPILIGLGTYAYWKHNDAKGIYGAHPDTGALGAEG